MDYKDCLGKQYNHHATLHDGKRRFYRKKGLSQAPIFQFSGNFRKTARQSG
jgi:hypothetical protein